ncbi:hypothetical protein SDC9_114689 [bioreactor metagenome]|uniref:Uncharacterized protein n=1 Tax=bioreactor metagenome TaxID=1076179 RepID=A0A645BR32_9ZZZZ
MDFVSGHDRDFAVSGHAFKQIEHGRDVLIERRKSPAKFHRVGDIPRRLDREHTVMNQGVIGQYIGMLQELHVFGQAEGMSVSR